MSGSSLIGFCKTGGRPVRPARVGRRETSDRSSPAVRGELPLAAFRRLGPEKFAGRAPGLEWGAGRGVNSGKPRSVPSVFQEGAESERVSFTVVQLLALLRLQSRVGVLSLANDPPPTQIFPVFFALPRAPLAPFPSVCPEAHWVGPGCVFLPGSFGKVSGCLAASSGGLEASEPQPPAIWFPLQRPGSEALHPPNPSHCTPPARPPFFHPAFLHITFLAPRPCSALCFPAAEALFRKSFSSFISLPGLGLGTGPADFALCSTQVFAP